ncbi:Holliday junction resolvase [Mycobacteroides abscessus subsp. bolletii]|uniref:hypothetical protein n=1 Tax=Mycobacteroides abscessus TaxID=36809 RepID=UPI00092B54B4|nr:hypothetical protein [Mycobacteroides abscessus]SIJ51543.1 Holliday junction resolvase [Mycobacteroides abscessus subsp. bolletii]SLD45911.1 Holliday junction resolvase [Mycobacteroides abscessus subsp. bolletii]SLE35561.1 Holliday junction resolvase [Mycobacteroides abscessus subsp. bolletii]
MTFRVLGLDPSLRRTGIAILTDFGGITAPSVLREMGEGSDERESYLQGNRRLRAVCANTMRIIDDYRSKIGPDNIDLAVIEGHAFSRNLPSVEDRHGLWHGLVGALDVRKIPIAIVQPSTRERFITGKASTGPTALPPDERKALVLAEIRKLFPQHRIANHDVADAVGLALMGAMHLGMTMPFRLRRCHIEGVHPINWPALTQPQSTARR